MTDITASKAPSSPSERRWARLPIGGPNAVPMAVPARLESLGAVIPEPVVMSCSRLLALVDAHDTASRDGATDLVGLALAGETLTDQTVTRSLAAGARTTALSVAVHEQTDRTARLIVREADAIIRAMLPAFEDAVTMLARVAGSGLTYGDTTAGLVETDRLDTLAAARREGAAAVRTLAQIGAVRDAVTPGYHRGALGRVAWLDGWADWPDDGGPVALPLPTVPGVEDVAAWVWAVTEAPVAVWLPTMGQQRARVASLLAAEDSDDG